MLNPLPAQRDGTVKKANIEALNQISIHPCTLCGDWHKGDYRLVHFIRGSSSSFPKK